MDAAAASHGMYCQVSPVTYVNVGTLSPQTDGGGMSVEGDLT